MLKGEFSFLIDFFFLKNILQCIYMVYKYSVNFFLKPAKN